MKQKKSLDAIGTILLFIGMFLAFLPHAFHARVGLGEETHTKHIVSGLILMVLGLGILIYNNNALRIWNKK